MIYVPPDLRTVAQGFAPYNGRNPNVLGRQNQTFLDNIQQHKVAWAGAQYRKSFSGPIVASARGKIDRVRTHNGYHGLEDDVTIDHGGAFKTRYFHSRLF
jgi:murein DD-endopeptidase MepM/ murein hydrolase activator NlpD